MCKYKQANIQAYRQNKYTHTYVRTYLPTYIHCIHLFFEISTLALHTSRRACSRRHVSSPDPSSESVCLPIRLRDDTSLHPECVFWRLTVCAVFDWYASADAHLSARTVLESVRRRPQVFSKCVFGLRAKRLPPPPRRPQWII